MAKQYLLLISMLFSGHLMAAQDPTAPLDWTSGNVKQVSPKKVVSVPNLQSIVCESSTSCWAVVSNKVVQTGDSVRGYKVINIEEQKVTLSRGSQRWNLSLFSQVKKN